MATWNSRGLRGSFLEEMVNLTNEKYRANKLALIQKVPTPIKPIRMDEQTRHITLAYFEQKSTVDYIGVVQGIPVCFDMYLPFAELKRFWDRMCEGGPKSFNFKELNPSWEISPYGGTFLHYLEQIQMDLERRNGK